MKKNQFIRRFALVGVFCFVLSVFATVAEARTLHLLTVGASESFKGDAKKNADLLTRHVRNFFRRHVPEENLNCVDVEASLAVINAEIAKLEVEEDDVVVFYYTGRAERKVDGAPDFLLTAKDQGAETLLSRQDVRRKIAQRRPRLFVVLSDCCDAYLPVANPKGVAEPAEEISPFAQKFLFEARGCVDITSSKSLKNPKTGSLATLAWLDVFDEINDALLDDPQAKIDWRKATEMIKKETNARFQARYPDGDSVGRVEQIPEAFELPGDPRFGARVQQRQNALIVTEVLKGSPAEKAGTKKNDKLIAVRYLDTDEELRPVAETDYTAAIDCAPRDVEVTVERKVDKKTKKLILRVELAGLPTQPQADEEEIDDEEAEVAEEETDDEEAEVAEEQTDDAEVAEEQTAAEEAEVAAEQTDDASVAYNPNLPKFGATVQGQAITYVVENSPAAKAGLEVGDKLLSFNGATIADARDFDKAVDASPVVAKLVVLKKSTNQQTAVEVRLNVDPNAYDPNLPTFGATVQGQEIVNVVANSPAAKAGLEVGDKLLSINGATISSGADFEKAVDASPIEAKLVVLKKSTNEQVDVDVRLNKK